MHPLRPTSIANKIGGIHQCIYQFATKILNSLIFYSLVQMPRPPKVSLILPAKYDLKQGGTSQQTGEKEKKTQLVSKEEGIRT